jgi:phosphoglycolate phosphatase-like HAD superfamily hydrolase
MGNNIDLVIFDCDGVLLDSEIIACAADCRRKIAAINAENQ